MPIRQAERGNREKKEQKPQMQRVGEISSSVFYVTRNTAFRTILSGTLSS